MAKSEAVNLLKTASAAKWKRIGADKRAGILVPLFSVHSKKSAGIGDLDDLKLVIDFCAATGASIIQLLPMNEIGSTFCPYDALSSFALEPTYISLAALAGANNKAAKAKIVDIQKEFPREAAHVDYAVKEAKKEALWQIYTEDGSLETKEFKKFVKDNEYWINDFALFKVLKHHHSGKPWYEWEDNLMYRDEKALRRFWGEHEKEIDFQVWLQFTAFTQFVAAKKYAASKDVLIKGDLPILISRDSADVWAHPEFFKLEFAAGAPPDMYCAKGQRWGMPTYSWESIAEDGYQYLKEKLTYAGNFYDILRVDHVVGLFRIWSIATNEPAENEGLNGVFDPKDENVWGDHGREILSVMLKNTDMLLCAEDLGMIPKMCPVTLKEFGIPGNEVQRWVKDWTERHDFLPPDEYRVLSVAMLSTHDTTNWSAWWENEAGTVDEALFMRKCRERGIDYNYVKGTLFDPKASRHGRLRWRDSVTSTDMYMGILGKRREELMDFIDMYENTYREKEKLWKHLGLKGPMREKADAEIVAAALRITLSSASIFCIELIIDYLYLTDMFKGDPYPYRINRPGTVNKNNWSLVMPIALENLLEHKVCKTIKSLITSSGR